MEITGINSNETLSPSTAIGGSEQLSRDSFMELLVAQLKNQDPLEPAKNTEMIAELAQFSTLEEMSEMNENLVGLAVLQQSNALMSQMTSASGLIGQTVQYVDPTSGSESWGEVSSVKIQEGLAVLDIGGTDVPLVNVLQIGPAASQGEGSGSESQA